MSCNFNCGWHLTQCFGKECFTPNFVNALLGITLLCVGLLGYYRHVSTTVVGSVAIGAALVGVIASSRGELDNIDARTILLAMSVIFMGAFAIAGDISMRVASISMMGGGSALLAYLLWNKCIKPT